MSTDENLSSCTPGIEDGFPSPIHPRIEPLVSGVKGIYWTQKKPKLTAGSNKEILGVINAGTVNAGLSNQRRATTRTAGWLIGSWALLIAMKYYKNK